MSLSPEMYKISEEDSQDEEVVSSRQGQGIALKLEPIPTDFRSWRSRQEEEDEDDDEWPEPPNFERLCPEGMSCEGKDNTRTFKNRGLLLAGNRTCFQVNSLEEWQESNSDSYLSSEERRNGVGSPLNNNQFISKTYFGDHLGEGITSFDGRNVGRKLQKRSRRRPSLPGRESSSGSDYSESSEGENLGANCNECVEGRERSRESSSSGDESSYSGSSQEYDDYDDEENEYFCDMGKYLTENEMESSTNSSGDLFVVEYAADSEPIRESGERRESEEGAPSQVEGEEEEIQSRNGDPPAPPTPAIHFQKSGKGTKAKISRLLKRRQDTNAVGAEVSISPQTCQPEPSSSSQVFGECVENQSKSQVSSPFGGIKQKVMHSSSISQVENGGGREKVFRFKDEDGGEARTVFLDVPQSKGANLGRRATLIESILGIVPGRFSTPVPPSSHSGGIEKTQDRIMVAGFLPDGLASRYRRIKIGDWLQSVDDIPVDHSNADQVLSSRSMYGKRRTQFETEYLRLKLVLIRVAGCMVSLPPNESEWPPVNRSREMRWSSVSPHVQSNVAILFISSGSEEPSANDMTSDDYPQTSACSKEKSKDVVFSWPKESDSKLVKALAASQGIFSTLYRLLKDVTGSHPIVSKVVIDDCELDVTYKSDDEGKSLLLVAVATSLSTFSIEQKVKASPSTGPGPSPPSEGKKKEKKIRWREPQTGGIRVSSRVMSRIETLLNYQFGSLARAFKEGNREGVSRLLTNSISALNDLSEEFLFTQVPGNFLRFPNSIRSGIDDILYSFETSDVLSTSGNNPKSGSRRSKEERVFHCHGSCLMYKGELVTCHLENELASDFHGWWRTQLALWEGIKRNSLERWKPISRLLLWQKTCIRSGQERRPRQEDGEQEDMLPSFSALVGIGHFTLGFVLQHFTECGQMGPDLGWLRRALATLDRLYQSGLSRSLECWLEKEEEGGEDFVELSGASSHNQNHPHNHYQVAGQEKFSNSSSSKVSSQPKKSPGTSSILKNSDPPPCPVHAGSSGSSTCTCVSSSPKGLGSPSTSSSQQSLLGSGVRSGLIAAMDEAISTGHENPMDSDEEEDDTTTGTGSDHSSFKWYESSLDGSGRSTTGSEVKFIRATRGNVLFDYIQVEFGRGVMLATKNMQQGWATQVRHNFRQTAILIHHILHKAGNARTRLEEGGSDKKWVSRALAPISEHGILFNCQVTEPRDLHKKKPRKREVNYWVVGRIYPEEREIYVCYEDGPMSQNLIEIAYKIALNVYC